MLKIRNTEIDPPLVLAPIAGHTDSLFRKAVKSFGGCGLVVSELVSTEGMVRNLIRTIHLTRFEECERPIAIQIFGSDPSTMAESALMVQEMGADFIDINVGCPINKVVKQGGGSNLLRDLLLLEDIFKAVRKAVTMPLTAKIRTGWDRKSINVLEVLRLAEDCGIEALTIHGRTRSDLFSGQADWDVIARAKQAARIPIIGNGDVFKPEDAARMFRETGVDGVMIGRGVLSNPWLMRQCHDHICGRAVFQVDIGAKSAFMLSFLRQLSETLPRPVAVGKMKRIGGYLARGMRGGGRFRAAIHSAHSAAEILRVVEDYRAENTC
jgi:tRNA-dihydrouridine synthase B